MGRYLELAKRAKGDPEATRQLSIPPTPDNGADILMGFTCAGCRQATHILYRVGRVYCCPSCLQSGTRIWWECGGEVRGPAVVQDLTFNSDGLWCWVKSPDREAWVLASHITKLEST